VMLLSATAAMALNWEMTNKAGTTSTPANTNRTDKQGTAEGGSGQMLGGAG
jgi:hypothetical protein